MPKKIAVEGNIACGKSTALAALAALAPKLRVFREPLEEWAPTLRKFYEDPGTWSFYFQLRVLLWYAARAAEGAGAAEAADAVFERSPMSSRHVFAQVAHNDGFMTSEDWDLYKDYVDALGWEPDAIVYVDTPTEVCFERLRARGRDVEAGVDLAYLRRLDFQYETMLRYANVPTIRVDGTLPPDALAAAVAEAVDSLALTRPGPS